MIKQYLNEIRVYTYQPYTKRIGWTGELNEEPYEKWSFHGDGQCDFEECETDASIEALESYIAHLENQITLTKKWITRKKERGQS